MELQFEESFSVEVIEDDFKIRELFDSKKDLLLKQVCFLLFIFFLFDISMLPIIKSELLIHFISNTGKPGSVDCLASAGLIIIDETKRNETKFCEILRNTAKYCEILRNMKKYGQITTKNAKILKPYHKYSLPWTQCGRQSSHGHTEKAEVCTTD